jgi:two-component system sensor histidine kinase/response regulator
MSTDDVVKLFRQDVNVRSIGSSTAKGTGIGLLLCKELAERSNGRIHVQSEEGKGSTFYLELPTA